MYSTSAHKCAEIRLSAFTTTGNYNSRAQQFFPTFRRHIRTTNTTKLGSKDIEKVSAPLIYLLSLNFTLNLNGPKSSWYNFQKLAVGYWNSLNFETQPNLMYIKTGHRFLTDKGQLIFPGPPIRVVAGDPIRDISIGDTDNEIVGGGGWNSLHYSDALRTTGVGVSDNEPQLSLVSTVETLVENNIKQILEGFFHLWCANAREFLHFSGFLVSGIAEMDTETNGGQKIRNFYIAMTSILSSVIIIMIICALGYKCYRK